MKRHSNNLKVAFFLGCMNPYSGGGWTRISLFAEYLSMKGFQVDVIGVSRIKSSKRPRAMIRGGLRILNVVPTLSYGSKVFSIFDAPLSILALVAPFIILRPKILVISVPGHRILTPIGAYIAGKISKTRIIFDYRDEWEDMALRDATSFIFKIVLKLVKRVMSLFYARSDVVLVNSPNFIDKLKMRGVTRVKVIFTGADVNAVKPYDKQLVRKVLGLPHDAFIVAYAGLIGGCYRLDVVIDALSKRKNVVLLMVGTGPEVRYILRSADKIGVKVYYYGVRNDKAEIAKILSAADVGIIPYDTNPLWKNTIPTKFYEYCACGLSVIATAYKDSMLANLINENKIGLVCKPLDVEELAEAIERLSKDEKFREEAARRARLMVVEIFDRNKLAEEFLNIIVGLLQDK